MKFPGDDVNEVRLAQEVKRIVTSLHESGPQDIYQLAQSERDPEDVRKTMTFLVAQNLVIERIDFPSAPNDPFSKVYSLPRVTDKKNKLMGW